MGHATHFLERLGRVEREEMELALSLYRDPALLKYILYEASLPEGAERVALSLGDPEQGPFVVVTRDGGFITCLGRGMRTDDLPIVTRQKLDRIAARGAGLRTKLREVGEYVEAEHGEVSRLYDRLLKGGWALSREDLNALRVLRLLQEQGYILACARSWSEFQKAQSALAQRKERRKLARGKGEDGGLQRLYRETLWSSMHLVVLIAHIEPERIMETLGPVAGDFMRLHAWIGVRTQVNRAAFLGFWASGRLGKLALPHLKGAYRGAQTWHQYLTTSFGLAAIALRHSTLRAEILKVLTKPPGTLAEHRELAQLHIDTLQYSIEVHLASDGKIPWEETLAAHAAKELLKMALEVGGDDPSRSLAVGMSDVCAMATFINTGFTTEPAALYLFTLMFPWVVTRRAEELFLPADIAWRLPKEWEADSTRDAIIHHVQDNLGLKPAAPRNVKRVGKDDPCPCGSGKRFRGCCQKR